MAAVVMLATLAAVQRRRNIAHFEHDLSNRRRLNADGIFVGAETINLIADSSRAVLLLHGFGDTPQSVKPLATALHAAGWNVRAPLMPGHGRALSEYAKATHRDWIGQATSTYDELSAQHETVVVCGISMGAALTVLLTVSRPKIPAIALLAPYLSMSAAMQVKTIIARLFQFVFPYRANAGSESSIHDPVARAATLGMGVVTGHLLNELRIVANMAEQMLPSVRIPTLYLQSREDNRIPQSTAIAEFARIGSQLKEQRWLAGCGHIITVDYCKDEVASQVIRWFANTLPKKLVSNV